MHTDEAVHAYKFGELLDGYGYRYDPSEYHGPSLYYLTLPLAWSRRENVYSALTSPTLRLLSVIAAALLIPALLLFRGAASKGSLALGGAYLLVSPILTYLSRYYIHEVLLALGSFVLLAIVWRYIRTPGWRMALAIGATIGFLHATKETFVFAIAAMAVALALVHVLHKPECGRKKLFKWKNLAFVFLGWFVIWLLLFSSFFTNMGGLLDSFQTFFLYLSRAGGQGHQKPWYYYLRLLLYYKNGNGFTASECYVIVLAVGTFAAALRSKQSTGPSRTSIAFIQFLGAYAILMLILYSCIPYKMPWLALSFMPPIYLLAAIGCAQIFTRYRHPMIRAVWCALIAASLWHLAFQARMENTRLATDERNPYVYSHTISDFARIESYAKGVADLGPEGNGIPIAVIAEEYWPAPWYLRTFSNVIYTKTHIETKAPIVISSAEHYDRIQSELQDTHVVHAIGLRHRLVVYMFIENERWNKYLDSL